MQQLINIPFYLFAVLWNSLVGLVNFILGIIAVLASTLAPFVPLSLFFVSNEKEAREVLEAKSIPAITTPADGELFSQLFELDPKIQRIRIEGNKIIVVDPSFSTDSRKIRTVNAHIYVIARREAPKQSLK